MRAFDCAARTEAACIAVQRELLAGIDQRDRLDRVDTVAGVDIAYWQASGGEQAVCCMGVIDCASRAVIEKRHAAGPVTFPYIPGCLAFRELPLVLEAAGRLETWPDLFFFDGNGFLHPRRMGLATHASFYLDAPAIGVAKHYFRVQGAVLTPPDRQAGAWGDIALDGEVLGRAVRTHTDVRPVYVSVGNYVTLDTATALALSLTDRESHIPIPTRYADLETHIQREHLKGRIP